MNSQTIISSDFKKSYWNFKHFHHVNYANSLFSNSAIAQEKKRKTPEMENLYFYTEGQLKTFGTEYLPSKGLCYNILVL